MKQYLELLDRVMRDGVDRPNRTGIDTRALFGQTLRFDLRGGFPAVTTKKLSFKSVVAELLWFLSGSCNVKDLQAMGCHIWDANAEAPYWKPQAAFDGDVGRIYGVEWVDWVGWRGVSINQIKNLINGLQNDPFDRRHIVTAWNPDDVINKRMCLPPCHIMFQCHVEPQQQQRSLQHVIHLEMYQRSCDLFLGVPFNVASYALLTHMLAGVCGYSPGELIIHLADCHIYHNHFDQVSEQLSRTPYDLPTLELREGVNHIDKFLVGDFSLSNYNFHPAISAPMAV